MPFADRRDVVKAFLSNRSNHALGIGVLPATAGISPKQFRETPDSERGRYSRSVSSRRIRNQALPRRGDAGEAARGGAHGDADGLPAVHGTGHEPLLQWGGTERATNNVSAAPEYLR